jgi:hypothetical protein
LGIDIQLMQRVERVRRRRLAGERDLPETEPNGVTNRRKAPGIRAGSRVVSEPQDGEIKRLAGLGESRRPQGEPLRPCIGDRLSEKRRGPHDVLNGTRRYKDMSAIWLVSLTRGCSRTTSSGCQAIRIPDVKGHAAAVRVKG